jgi:small subunit ribosomal protein S1
MESTEEHRTPQPEAEAGGEASLRGGARLTAAGGRTIPVAAEADDDELFGDPTDRADYKALVTMYDESMRNLNEGEIVTGRVIGITANDVVVDVGYKSEGLVPKAEFLDREGNLKVKVGEEIDVLLEKAEDQEGHVLLSRQKAERLRRWTDIEQAYKDGSIINGRVIDRIKGGLTVATTSCCRARRCWRRSSPSARPRP